MIHHRAFAALALAAATLAPGAAAAQSIFENEASIVEGEHPFRSPQKWAFELRFGPYLPNVDGEFDGARTPYRDFFGDSQHLMSQIEVDYEFFHRFGTLAAGLGIGYFSVTGRSNIDDGSGLPSGDTSTLKMIPLSLSAVYRFDRLLETRGFPIVPYGKLGLDYAYWQITDGNGEIATDSRAGAGAAGRWGGTPRPGSSLVLDIFDPERRAHVRLGDWASTTPHWSSSSATATSRGSGRPTGCTWATPPGRWAC